MDRDIAHLDRFGPVLFDFQSGLGILCPSSQGSFRDAIRFSNVFGTSYPLLIEYEGFGPDFQCHIHTHSHASIVSMLLKADIYYITILGQKLWHATNNH